MHGRAALRPAVPLPPAHAGAGREVCDTQHRIRHPHAERTAGRPLRASPVYGRQAAHGAVFGETPGWEQVRWYAANEAAGDPGLRPRGWAGRHWSPAIGAEHRACREGVALFDATSLGKLELSGPGAHELLERLCANRVRREAGQVTSTHMLNRRGGMRVRRDGLPDRGGPLRRDLRRGAGGARPRLDPLAPARGGSGRRPGRRRDVAVGVLRGVGTARRRAARRVHDR